MCLADLDPAALVPRAALTRGFCRCCAEVVEVIPAGTSVPMTAHIKHTWEAATCLGCLGDEALVMTRDEMLEELSAMAADRETVVRMVNGAGWDRIRVLREALADQRLDETLEDAVQRGVDR